MPPWRAKKSSSATVRIADFTPGPVVSDGSIPALLERPACAALTRDPAISPEPDHSLVRHRSVQICEQWLWLWTLCGHTYRRNPHGQDRSGPGRQGLRQRGEGGEQPP